ncbi:Smr/MutS family protein [Candidatus Thioglobus sp.]|nr:Smr/MutS family protein [Candidatus Thioglobus sp.]
MINDNDKQLFRDSVDASIPIDKDGANPKNNQVKKAAFTAYSYIIEARLDGSQTVAHAKNGLSPKIIKKMKRGDIDYAPTLDLHGFTTVEACEAMSEFMHYYQHENFIHIIHGKGYNSENGMSILKTQVVSFLSQHPQVLAFNSCPDKDGGTGAIFALLKQ